MEPPALRCQASNVEKNPGACPVRGGARARLNKCIHTRTQTHVFILAGRADGQIYSPAMHLRGHSCPLSRVACKTKSCVLLYTALVLPI